MSSFELGDGLPPNDRSAMEEVVIRFVIGRFAVSAFAALGDVFRPQSFAGLFGAAPSIALATLAIAFLATVLTTSRLQAVQWCWALWCSGSRARSAASL